MTLGEIHKLGETVMRLAFRLDVESGMNAYNECRLCGASVYHDQDLGDIKHNPHCAYLIAQKAIKEV